MTKYMKKLTSKNGSVKIINHAALVDGQNCSSLQQLHKKGCTFQVLANFTFGITCLSLHPQSSPITTLHVYLPDHVTSTS